MKRKDEIKITLENEVEESRFSMARLFSSVADSGVFAEALQNYRDNLGRSTADHVFKGIMRSAFLIELVKKPKIETTKYRVRWTEQFDPGDPRYASYEECFRILERVLTDLENAMDDVNNQKLLKLFRARNLVPYEVPLDYKERRTEVHIHRSSNIIWFFDSLPRRVVELRTFLMSKKTNPHVSILRELYKKIKVKTYLTDRVLTGDHKTNREKRWETHPESVHFAFRRSCMEIELALIDQLCRFEGFPADLKRKIEDLGIISTSADTFRCPITMEPLSFAEFEREIKDPEHGKAIFQVGHPNPLKAISDDTRSGHAAENISWVSSDGNRIQCHLSHQETRALIRRIHANYQQFGVE